MAEKSFVNPDKLKELNAKVYERGHVDREHLLEFLKLVETSDALLIIKEVKDWLEALHTDPYYSKVSFPKGDIEAILGDLDSYGHVSAETILQFKQDSNKALPIS